MTALNFLKVDKYISHKLKFNVPIIIAELCKIVFIFKNRIKFYNIIKKLQILSFEFILIKINDNFLLIIEFLIKLKDVIT